MVDTPLFEISGVGDILEDLKKLNPVLQVSDIVDGIIYVLSTPPHVQVDIYRRTSFFLYIFFVLILGA